MAGAPGSGPLLRRASGRPHTSGVPSPETRYAKSGDVHIADQGHRRRAVRPLGLTVRAGLHTGEVELFGDKVSGLAVHIGARVATAAGPGEVLVSSTVRDLVAGSGLRFEDRGVHALKGVPGAWRLFAVTGAGGA